MQVYIDNYVKHLPKDNSVFSSERKTHDDLKFGHKLQKWPDMTSGGKWLTADKDKKFFSRQESNQRGKFEHKYKLLLS